MTTKTLEQIVGDALEYAWHRGRQFQSTNREESAQQFERCRADTLQAVRQYAAGAPDNESFVQWAKRDMPRLSLTWSFSGQGFASPETQTAYIAWNAAKRIQPAERANGAPEYPRWKDGQIKQTLREEIMFMTPIEKHGEACYIITGDQLDRLDSIEKFAINAQRPNGAPQCLGCGLPVDPKCCCSTGRKARADAAPSPVCDSVQVDDSGKLNAAATQSTQQPSPMFDQFAEWLRARKDWDHVMISKRDVEELLLRMDSGKLPAAQQPDAGEPVADAARLRALLSRARDWMETSVDKPNMLCHLIDGALSRSAPPHSPIADSGVRDALIELVELKGIRDRIERCEATGPEKIGYRQRKDVAWKRARAALAAQPKEQNK